MILYDGRTAVVSHTSPSAPGLLVTVKGNPPYPDGFVTVTCDNKYYVVKEHDLLTAPDPEFRVFYLDAKHHTHHEFSRIPYCSPECREAHKPHLLEMNETFDKEGVQDGVQDGVWLISSCFYCHKPLRSPSTHQWHMVFWKNGDEYSKGPFTEDEARDALDKHPEYAYAYHEGTHARFDNGKIVNPAWDVHPGL